MSSVDVIKSIKDKIGKFFSHKVTIIFVAVIIVISIIFLFYNSFAKSVKIYTEQLKNITEQNEILQKNFKKDLEVKDKELKNLAKKIVAYNKDLKKQNDKIKKLEEKYQNVQLPKTRDELIYRFNLRGFNPR